MKARSGVRAGSALGKQEIAELAALQRQLESSNIFGKNRIAIIKRCEEIRGQRQDLASHTTTPIASADKNQARQIVSSSERLFRNYMAQDASHRQFDERVIAAFGIAMRPPTGWRWNSKAGIKEAKRRVAAFAEREGRHPGEGEFGGMLGLGGFMDIYKKALGSAYSYESMMMVLSRMNVE